MKNKNPKGAGRKTDWISDDDRSVFRSPNYIKPELKKIGVAIDAKLNQANLKEFPQDKFARLLNFIYNELF